MPKSKDFYKLRKSVRNTYLGKPVPRKYRERYGKKYDLEDVDRVVFAIAKRRGIKIDK